MPFPSGGCQTCRKRRIKCDETHPFCNQCMKSARQCIGFGGEKGSLQFRSENTYAAGNARKPRKRSHQNSQFQTQVSMRRQPDQTGPSKISPHELNEGHLSSGPWQRAGAEGAGEQVPRSISISLEDRALANFALCYIDPEAPECMWSHMKDHRVLWQVSNPASTLGLSVAAVSMATFGKMRCIPISLSASSGKYIHAVAKIRAAMDDIREVVADQFLLSILLLSSYENTLGNYQDNLLLASSFRHETGALAVMKARKDHSSLTKRNLHLDRIVRRQIVRTSITRGKRLPFWLQDGEEFGEEGVELELDKRLVEVSRLRCDALAMRQTLKGLTMAESQPSTTSMRKLIYDCQAVNQMLSDWAESLPAEWNFENLSLVDPPSWKAFSTHGRASYDGTKHFYPSLDVAVTWNRYRGARLVCNSIILKILSYCLSMTGEATRREDLSDYKTTESNTKILVDEICASIPFHFGGTRLEEQKESLDVGANMITGQINARAAFLLAWPLLISSVVWGLSEEQRRLVKAQLLLVGQITASSTFETLARGK